MARTRSVRWLLLVVTLLLALPGLDVVHLFDWDEINFAEAAREMNVLGDYLRVYIDYRPFWEKPPLFFWKQALAMRWLGPTETAARLPNALLGVLVSAVFLFRGKKWFGVEGSLLWVMWWGAFLPHLYFRSGLIDPWFNAYMFFAAWAAVRGFMQGAFWPWLPVGGVLWGLAVLTKGPVALGLVGVPLLAVWTIHWSRRPFSVGQLAAFLAIALATAFSWFAVEYAVNGPWFIREFVRYQVRLLSTPDAGHGGPWWYHLAVLYLGCFPASFVLIRRLLKKRAGAFVIAPFPLMLMAMLLTVLVVFSIVKTKIVHYSSLAYYPIVILAARALQEAPLRPRGVGRFLFWSTAFLLGGVLLLVPLAGMTVKEWLPLVQDPFTKGALTEPVSWPWLGILPVMAVLSFWMLTLLYPAPRRAFSVALGILLLAQWVWYYALPRIERYTQGPAIDFYQAMAGRPAYVSVIGFKSYAHLFYTKKAPPPSPEADDLERLLTMPVDSPVWLVTRIDRLQRVKRDYPVQQLMIAKKRGGYVFFRREAEIRNRK